MRGMRSPYWSIVVGERDAVVFLRQHLADDLQADEVVVVFHLARSAGRPTSPCALDLRVGPELRQRALAHVAIAAEEILALVLVVPVLGDGERGRPFVRSGPPPPSRPRPPGSIAPSGSCRPGPKLLARPSGNRSVAEFNKQSRRLDRVAGDHDVARVLKTPAAFAMIVHAGRQARVDRSRSGRPSRDRGFPRRRRRARESRSPARSAWRWWSSRSRRSRDRRKVATVRAAPRRGQAASPSIACPSPRSLWPARGAAALSSCARYG